MKTLKSINSIFKFFSTIMIMLTLSFGSVSVAYADSPANTNANEYHAGTVKGHYSDSDYVDGQSEGLMDWLILIATSVIAARLTVNCSPMPADLIAASAAGAIEIAGEVMEMIGYEDDLEALDMNYNVGALSESQREALIKQREAYADQQESLESKLVFQKAAAAAYLVAAGIVLGLWITYQTTDTSCKTSMYEAAGTDLGICTPPCTGPQAAACIALCQAKYTACTAGLAAGDAEDIAAKAKEAVPSPSLEKSTTAKTVSMSIASEKTSSCTANATTVATISGCKGTIDTMIANMYAGCNPAMGVVKNDVIEKDMNESQRLYADAFRMQQGAIIHSQMIANTRFSDSSKFQDYYSIVPHFGIDSLVSELNNDTLNQYIDYKETVRVVNNEVHSLNIDEYHSLVAINNVLPVEQKSTLFRAAMLSGTDLVIPNAEAVDWLKALKIVGPMLGAYLLAQTSIGSFIDSYIASPVIRGVMWAALAANTYSAASTTESNIDEIDNRIAKINQILVELANHQNNNPVQEGDGGNKGNVDYGGYNHGPVSNVVLQEQICAEAGDDQCVNVGSATKKANSKLAKMKNFPKNKSLSQAQALTAMVADQLAIDSKNGKISKGTLGNLKALGDQSAYLKKLVKDRQDKINSMLKSNGQKPMNFADMTKKFDGGIRAAALKPLASKNITPRQLVSGMFGDGRKVFVAAPKKEKDENMSSKGKVVKVDGKGKKEEKKKEKMIDLAAFEDDKLETIEGENAASEVNSAEELAKLNYDVEDIVKNKDVSIFTVLTSRYFSSAYPKIFNKKKKDE